MSKGHPEFAEKRLDRIDNMKVHNVNPVDQSVTPVHLLDGVMHGLLHAHRHTERFRDAAVRRSQKQTDFHYKHAAGHIAEAQSHAEKLIHHLGRVDTNSKVFKQEHDALKHEYSQVV